jgi:hypothetical protein
MGVLKIDINLERAHEKIKELYPAIPFTVCATPVKSVWLAACNDLVTDFDINGFKIAIDTRYSRRAGWGFCGNLRKSASSAFYLNN